jgi:hypothetical protein
VLVEGGAQAADQAVTPIIYGHGGCNSSLSGRAASPAWPRGVWGLADGRARVRSRLGAWVGRPATCRHGQDSFHVLPATLCSQPRSQLQERTGRHLTSHFTQLA